MATKSSIRRGSSDSAGLAGYPTTKTQFNSQLAIIAILEDFHTSQIQHVESRRLVANPGRQQPKHASLVMPFH